MWGRPAVKSCEIDVESHVNVRFLVPGYMGFPCGRKGGGGFRVSRVQHGIPMSGRRSPWFTGTSTWNSHVRKGKPWFSGSFTWHSHVRTRSQDRFTWQFPCKYIPLVSFTWQIPCKSALASSNEASGRLPRHISQNYLILLSDILFQEVFHADDVSAKIW